MEITEYITFINAPTRQIKAYVEIYLIPGEPPLIIYGDEIHNFDLWEELKYDRADPLGGISANTFSLTLLDPEHLFNPGNATSPYKEYLIPGVKIIPYLGIMGAQEVHYEKMGVYFVTDWCRQSDFPTVKIPCKDRLYYEGQLELPETRVTTNITLKNLFIKVFTLAGIPATDYNINLVPDSTIKFAWLPKGTLLSTLQLLVEASGANVYIDRQNIYRVENSNVATTTNFVLTEQDQVISYQNPVTFDSIYSGVSMDVYTPVVTEVKEILSLKEVILSAGVTKFLNYTFTEFPIAKVDSIQIYGVPDARVQLCSAGNRQISLEIYSVAGGIADISIMGSILQGNPQTITQIAPEALALIGEKVFEIKNHLIQDPAFATSYRNTLLLYNSQPDRSVFTSIRGNPKIVLNSKVNIRELQQRVDAHDLLVSRIKTYFDGGLSMDIEGVKI